MANENIQNTQITEEQAEQIATEIDKSVEGTALEELGDLPSNNGKIERTPEEIAAGEKGTVARVLVGRDPNTGEHRVEGPVTSEAQEETFEEMAERISNSEIKLDETPITKEEIQDYIKTSGTDETGLLAEVADGANLSDAAIIELLEIVNRKMKKEEFNVYKAYPQEIRDMIDKYMVQGQIPLHSADGKRFRNMIAESMIDEFITNISLSRIQHDFSKEMEELFNKGTKEIAETVVGYTQERNQMYRDYAEKIEDPEKKEKMYAILGKIDEAYALTDLKEFSKNCKIKPIEIEKPEQRVFNDFLRKYEDSAFNIYDIKVALPVLVRNLAEYFPEKKYEPLDSIMFFICFCKFCRNMKPDVTTDHAFMYYVLYNVVLVDMNKGESAQVSIDFLKNVAEVIDNLRARNKK